MESRWVMVCWYMLPTPKMSPTRKVKRALMYERFKALIESMYDDHEERLVAQSAGNVLR